MMSKDVYVKTMEEEAQDYAENMSHDRSMDEILKDMGLESAEDAVRILEYIRWRIVGSLRAVEECDCDADTTEYTDIQAVADRLENGTANHSDWMEGIDQMDTSEW